MTQQCSLFSDDCRRTILPVIVIIDCVTQYGDDQEYDDDCHGGGSTDAKG